MFLLSLVHSRLHDNTGEPRKYVPTVEAKGGSSAPQPIFGAMLSQCTCLV